MLWFLLLRSSQELIREFQDKNREEHHCQQQRNSLMVRALWAQSHTREEKSPLIRAEQSEIRADKENRLCQTAQTGEVQFWQSGED